MCATKRHYDQHEHVAHEETSLDEVYAQVLTCICFQSCYVVAAAAPPALGPPSASEPAAMSNSS